MVAKFRILGNQICIYMETNITNPLLNFRLVNERYYVADVNELDLISGMNESGFKNFHNHPGGSFITLTRETADNTESSG